MTMYTSFRDSPAAAAKTASVSHHLEIPMRSNLSRPEQLLLTACLALLLAALAWPAVRNPPHAHDFADQRALFGVQCALDVVSNLPFALAGIVGFAWLRRASLQAVSQAQREMAALFFAGLVAAAAASSFYHRAPDDFGLAVDRTGMSIAFAGLLGLLVAARVSDRAGRTLAGLLLVLGPVAAWTCFAKDNVLPWAAVQFGGMALVLALAFLRNREGAIDVRWGLVLLAYAVAKVCELGDHVIFEATGQLFSGHTLKHVVAAFAAYPVIAAFAAHAGGQNGPATALSVAA
jgi:hypothetical protein